MARKTAYILCGVFALSTLASDVVHAEGRRLAITTPVVAGAPGTTAVPDVEISYVGGDRSDAFDLEIQPVSGQWNWAGPAEAIDSEFNPACAVSSTGTLMIIGGGAGVGAHAGPTPVCRAKVAVAPGVADGLRPFPAAPPTLLTCYDATGVTVPCAFSAGTLLVGERTGSASIAYQPSPSSTIALGIATTSIGVSYQPGSAGDGVVVSGCRLAGDPVVRPPRTSPAYLGFAGLSPNSGAIALACIGGLPAGNATLTCDERINLGASQSRSWILGCPETRVPPTIDYSVPPGTPILAVGGDFAGDPAAASVGVTIRNDGLGIGLLASSTVSDCLAPAPFVVTLTPSPVEGEGTNGATGTMVITCSTETMPVDRNLSCTERRGTNTLTRTWPLGCPALPSLVVFADGFEAVALP